MVADMGKVREVKVEDLKAGMKVERDVLGRGDKVLVSAGEVLTRKHVQQLQKWEQREKPRGPALRKKNPKDLRERYQHAEFQGGWRPSHFNPRGVKVSTTLASGDEAPAVEKDPTLSPLAQNTPRKSFGVGDINVDPPLLRQRALQAEIQALETTNKALGGSLHEVKFTYEDGKYEESLTTRKEALAKDNERLIAELRTPKTSEGKDAATAKADKPGPRKK